MCSSLACCASRQVHAGVAVVGAGVDPQRVEPERVEVVGDVVVELDLPGVDLGPVARLRARPARTAGAASRQRRRRRPSTCGRVAGHQLGGERHQVAHAAVDVDPAFDVVLADLADLAGHEVGERRQLVQPQRHGGVAASRCAGRRAAPPPAAGVRRLQSLLEGGVPAIADMVRASMSTEPEFTEASDSPGRDAGPQVSGGACVGSAEGEDAADRPAAAALRRGRALEAARPSAGRTGRSPRTIGSASISASRTHVVGRLGDLLPHPGRTPRRRRAAASTSSGRLQRAAKRRLKWLMWPVEVGHQDAVADRLERRLRARRSTTSALRPASQLVAPVEQRHARRGRCPAPARSG